jgi:quercetin dioxygenase-like cupin family protein
VCSGCGALLEADTEHRCVRATSLDRVTPGAGGDGVVWSLGGARQLEANLVVLGSGSGIGQHRNDDVDVLIVVLGGSGRVVVDDVAWPVAAHDFIFVPRGSRRSIAADGDGIRYLSTHIARPGPTIGTARPGGGDGSKVV